MEVGTGSCKENNVKDRADQEPYGANYCSINEIEPYLIEKKFGFSSIRKP